MQSITYPSGVSALTRASRFGRVSNYAKVCSDELCLLVQIETPEAFDNLEAIAAMDGIFIGPGDLASNIGHLGEPGNPAVVAKIENAIKRIAACGKPAGILAGDEAFAKRCISVGPTFTAVGVDVGLLARATTQLRQQFSTMAWTNLKSGLAV